MRGFLIFLVLCLVVVGALGFYLNWWGFSTSTDANTGKTNVQLTIDKKKMSQDVQSGVGGLRDLVAGKSFEGSIQSLDAVTRSVNLKNDAGDLTVRATDETKIQLLSGPGTFPDLKQGMRVNVAYETRDNIHSATKITELKAEK
ncbi:MAG: hypothetical protein L0Y72_20125 [Gemmataceae bacterium]|nr:hypothetical protein [Gemmataceae bacterium]MCI0741345.1 hypothetical protein [Gemmataceae bacterium]